MPCKDAMIEKVISLTPDMIVEDALHILEHEKIRTAPVISSDNRLLGMFGFMSVMRQVLPVSVTMTNGLEHLDFARGAKPDIAKRINEIKSKPVESAMEQEPITISPDLSVWEGILKLTKHGSPLPVVESGTQKFLGILTEQSAISELELIVSSSS
ncbi:CBS domain-containing protein [Cohaesibacter marisflavi]|uniref:CBS domain-containing protein n=1 Tax=Cohaesibacter marisflavi TaxID=655353 RepID=A0A1I5J7Q5_9HYPH|nr:CBS domain-containing protein [Cohaesibacter marisflavi]SFO68762.1 CBS domain-containing protein [Cohaesibacter marisflavi]